MEPNGKIPGKDAAIVSLAVSALGTVLWFLGKASLISVVLGVVGLIFAKKAKQSGFHDILHTLAFVLSLVSLIGGAISTVLWVASLAVYIGIMNSVSAGTGTIIDSILQSISTP